MSNGRKFNARRTRGVSNRVASSVYRDRCDLDIISPISDDPIDMSEYETTGLYPTQEKPRNGYKF